MSKKMGPSNKGPEPKGDEKRAHTNENAGKPQRENQGGKNSLAPPPSAEKKT